MLGAQRGPMADDHGDEHANTGDRDPRAEAAASPSTVLTTSWSRTASGADRTSWGATSSSLTDATRPSDWIGCERIRIDTNVVAEPLPTVERLRAAAFERRGVVIELAGDTAPPAVERRPIHELGARFAFDGDELHHLTWSNSIDGRDPASTELVARRSGGGARRRRSAVPPTSCSPTARPRGSTVGRSASPIRSTGVPVLHAVAVEHGSLAPPVSNVSGADARRRPTRGGRARRWRGPHHRPRRIRQDPGAHRASTPPARRMAAAAERRQPRRVQQAGAGGDARTHGRPPRSAGPHAQRDRARHRQWRPAVPRPTSVVAHDRRARCAPRAVEADRLPEASQHRSGGTVDRGAERDPARAARPARRRTAVRRRRRRAHRGVAEVPRRARTRARHRLRRPDLPGDRGPASASPTPERRRNGRAG